MSQFCGARLVSPVLLTDPIRKVEKIKMICQENKIQSMARYTIHSKKIPGRKKVYLVAKILKFQNSKTAKYQDVQQDSKAARLQDDWNVMQQI